MKSLFLYCSTALACALAFTATAQEAATPSANTNAPATNSYPGWFCGGVRDDGFGDWWNFHMANTDVGQLHPSFPAQYSGPNSMNSHFESAETVSFDNYLGLRLWKDAEFHLDALAWQGFGLSKTFGIEAFPSAEAYKLGSPDGNITLARAFIRQTFNLGGESQQLADDPFHLPGKQDESRIVVTVGEISLLDIFDNNAYASDPSKQFLNWALVGNEAWDYPANSLGFITGLAGEFYQPDWTLRYGFFQMPKVANGLAIDQSYLKAWGMITEFERRFKLADHPGTVRLLAYVNRAHMGSYEDAVDDSAVRPANIVASADYRYKYGFCLNLEQEVFTNVGLFTRLGWSDGHTQAWAYSDVDDSASMGVSLNGALWNRAGDTYGLAGIVSAASKIHQEFLADGGAGILAGDGALSYGLEKVMETYYSFHVWRTLQVTADYQFIIDPAFNRARGPVSVLGGRIHWEF